MPRSPSICQDAETRNAKDLRGFRQVHRMPSTTTGPERQVHGYAKFCFEHVRLHPVMRQVPRPRVHLPRQDRTKTCTSTVVLSPSSPYRHENNYFLYELDPL